MVGCGIWLKKLNKLKKAKGGSRKPIKVPSTNAKSNDIVWKPNSQKSSTIFDNATCDSSGNRWILGRPIEDVAATKIQTSYRAYRATKSLRQLKGIVRLKKLLAQGDSEKRQVASTLNHFHIYGKIQDEIKARRLCMVVEGRLRQKKFENQLKLDAKLHKVETEWSCTPKSMDDIVAKIHIREEAAVKRERALSYAFNHQWRANASQIQLMGSSECGKPEWGWSWMELWVAARPWESRITDTLKTGPITPTSRIGKTKTKVSSTPSNSSSPKRTLSRGKVSTTKRTLSNGKGVVMTRRLSYPPPSTKPTGKKDIIVKTTKSMKDAEPNTVTSN